jgi:acyl-coenzyme A synthetase/AMP-(fatty) acid ligase
VIGVPDDATGEAVKAFVVAATTGLTEAISAPTARRI